jgi:hypothetical protein
MPRPDLRAELGADPPPGLVAALSPKELGELTSAVREAKARQRAALDRAANDALGHLPGLVRRAVLRMLR